MVSELTNNRVTTFLRRALRRKLHFIAILGVKNADVESVRESGKSISQNALCEQLR